MNREDVLNKIYWSAKDIKVLIPDMGINQCRDLVNQLREQMKEKNMLVPDCRTKLILASFAKKRLGI